MKRDTLHNFFDNRCSDEEKYLIKAWLESAPHNMDILQEERRLFDQLILTPMHTTTLATSSPKKTFHLNWIQLAAIALLCGMSVLLIYTWKKSVPNDVQWTTIKAPYGNRVQLWLPDSTLVWLNAGTTLRYPNIYTSAQRQVILEGEAYFEVTRNVERKFTVQTAFGDIEVLGTKFNVEASEEKQAFKTALMEGKVRVISSKNKSINVILKPGELAELRNEKFYVRSISDYSLYDWREGIVSFSDLSTDELALLVKKYYDIDLDIQNKNLKKHRYSGKFRTADGIDQLLRILQRYEHFNVKRIDNKNKIELM